MAKKTKNFSAKLDFTVEMLPHDRKTQFFTVLRNRIPLLIKLGLITLAFFIPLILAGSYKTTVVYNFYKRFTAGEFDEKTLQSYLSYTDFIASLAYIPCFLTGIIGICGVSRITHRLVFGEGVLFKQDFLLGIKQNAKQYLTFTLVYSCIYALIRFALFYFNSNVAVTVTAFITAIAVLPYAVTSFVYGNVYTSVGAELLSNVFRAQIKSKFTAIWVSAIIALPPILISLFCSGYLYLFLSAVYAFILPLYSLTANSAFANVFDQTFNLLNHPEIVKKGLYVSEKEKEIIRQTHLRLKNEVKEKGDSRHEY